MNKNKFFLLIIIIILVIVSIIFISNIINEPENIDNDDIIIEDDISLFLGKWDDTFYSLAENSYGTWEFYENNSIKNLTTGLTYDGSKTITIIKWHEFKLEDGLIYLKFDTDSVFKSYEYVFSNNNKHLSIYESNDILGTPFKLFNR